ncbi:hypothetical protein NKG94_11085 [Micromonospora sp. M12]
MVTYGRGVLGEYSAAFSLSSVELFLKGPDANVKVAGTDLVGIGHDGWVWLIDDKSHRATSVSGVSALTDNLATNLRRDAADFREAIARLHRDDPASPRPAHPRRDLPDGGRRCRDRPDQPARLRVHPACADQRGTAGAPAAAARHQCRRRGPRDHPGAARPGLAVEPTGTPVPLPPPEGAEHGHHQQLHAVRHGAVRDHQRRDPAHPDLGGHRHLPGRDVPPAADRLHRAQGHRGHPRRHHHVDRGAGRRGTLRLEVRPGDDGRGEQTRHGPGGVLRGSSVG